MTEYPKEAYAPAMGVYKHIPDELKEEASKILGMYREKYAEGEAPPYEMARRLLSLVPKDQQSGLEEILKSAKEIEEKGRQQEVKSVPTSASASIFSDIRFQYAAAGALIAILVSML